MNNDNTETSQIPTDFTTLEASAKKIVKQRAIGSAIITVLFVIIAYVLYINLSKETKGVDVILWIVGGITAICFIVFIIELCNIRRIHSWYYYVNYFTWNILGQIREFVLRSDQRAARSGIVSSIISFRAVDTVRNAYELNRVEQRIKDNQTAIRSTYIVDRYIDTRDASKIDTQPH